MVLRTRSKTQSLQSLIRSVHVAFSAHFNRVLTPQGVSLAQFAVLLVLAQESPRKMGDVARAINVSHPAVTYLVDRLQQRKLILRKPDPRDRRVTLLELTGRGKSIVKETQGKTLAIMGRSFSRYKKNEREAILGFMRDLKKGMSEEMKA